jgi:hypothetical protein
MKELLARYKYLELIIKKYYTVIALFPFLLGGIVQCYQLFKIGIGYIRFFSSTQLLQDGLVIISIMFLVFCIPLVLSFFLGFLKGWGIGVVLMLLIYTFLLIHQINRENFEWNIAQKLNVALLIVMLITSIFNFFLLYKKIYKPNLFRVFVGFGILVFVFMFLSLYLYPRESKPALTPQEFGNIANLRCVIKNENIENTGFKLLYFNDRYLFVEILNGEQKEIRIFPFETFYDSSKCNITSEDVFLNPTGI